MKKHSYVSLICLFLLIVIISGVMIIGHYREANEQEDMYNNLAQIVEQNETSENTEITPTEPTPTPEGEAVMLPEYCPCRGTLKTTTLLYEESYNGLEFRMYIQ